MPQTEDIAKTLYQAFETGRVLSTPTTDLPNLSIADAYDIQNAFVTLRLDDDELGGFKAGLTAAPAQESFGVDHPISGALFRSGERRDGATVSLGDYRALLLETELGFRMGTAISQRVADTYQLRESVAGCLPMVELAELCYGDAKVTGADLIAANSASAAYMRGAMPNWRDHDLNAVTVTFSRNGETLHEASAGDVMDDQWQALLWLVNQVIDQGHTIEPGMFLMTGSIGPPHPGKPGSYVADYGSFGRLKVTITD